LSAVLQVAVVQLPFLNEPFSTTPLGVRDWLICIGLASIVLWADEVKKVVQRRM
jgi:Ca2+-transporting ATPase